MDKRGHPSEQPKTTPNSHQTTKPTQQPTDSIQSPQNGTQSRTVARMQHHHHKTKNKQLPASLHKLFKLP